ncbi:MAG TPA: primosomal protein N' [Terriglobales bacterium]|nr:primosomal protein N' [Terriglobales bacterium]
MPTYCDVALPVPLDMVFTYAIPPGMEPVVGGRVLVPFRQQRFSGIVVELHDRLPQVKTKKVIEALDLSPVLDEQLLKLGKWIADYYLAPVGEVFRTMLPLSAEFKRAITYRITGEGQMALHLAGMSGSPGRSRRTPDEQLLEFRVLDYLAERESVREERLRGATRVSKALLSGMVRKKWIAREDVSAARDAARTVKVAVLRSVEGDVPLVAECGAPGVPARLDGRVARPHTDAVTHASERSGDDARLSTPPKKLNENQRTLLETLIAAGGKVPVEALGGLDVPRTTLSTLMRRGLVDLVDEPQDFTMSKIKPRRSPFEFEFNPAQKEALGKILEGVSSRKFSGMLLHGVTGSGKTAVYLAGMRELLEQGRSAILLVPEIGLTPAVAADLHQVFGDEVAILHSGLTDAERAQQWHRIKRGEARVVVGTRSAVFAPVGDLALIIVDEEQDASYKQEETPRYHARDVAVMRAKMAGAVVVLGSATPSLESYYNAKKNKYALVELPDRVEQRPLPEVEILDMRQEFQETGHEQVISRKLAEEIRERLEKKEQVMVLLNRRGYSPVALCRACGKTLQCKNCAVSMTHHKRERKMECHYCGHVAHIPDKCAVCDSEYVYFVGTGSEKLEELLHGMFPQARIGRLDRDTVRGREDFERALNALNEGELDMLVGTQMIAKGHDVHGVTLVGVVGADIALGLPDFRAAERTFQLLTQVAGRAGRGESPGRVVLQTYFPDHYAVQFAARHDFAGFYDKELQFRSWMHYPPYSAIANVLIRSEKLDEALTWSGELGRWFEKTRHEGIRVLGPAAAPIIRLKRDYRYHFILKSPSREKMNTLLRAMLAEAATRKIPRTHIIVDVDAVWLM